VQKNEKNENADIWQKSVSYHSISGCNESVLHCTFLQNGVAGSVATPEILFWGCCGVA